VILRDEDLQRYFDEDLAPDHARRTEEALASSDEDRKRIAALGQIRTLLRASAQQTAADAPSDAMWAAIGAELAKRGGPGWLERLGVRFRELLVGPARIWVPAAAAAAALLLAFLLRPEVRQVAAHDVVIESVETDGVTATVFQMPDDTGGDGISVLWITPEQGGEE